MRSVRSLAPLIPRPATVIATLALCLTGAAGATAATLITGSEIKNGSITGADVKRGSLTAQDLSPSARRRLRGHAGSTGIAGPQGPPGEPGTAGPSSVLIAQASAVDIDSEDGAKQVAELVLPPGSFSIDAVLSVRSEGSGDVCELRSSDGLLEELQFTVGDNDGDQLLLQGEFDTGSRPSGRIRVSCSADDALVADARIRALEVARAG